MIQAEREDERDDVSSSYKPDTDFEGEPGLSDVVTTDSPSWLTKIQRTMRKLFNAVNFFETPLSQTDASHVRKEYDELSSKLSKLQSRVSSLTQKLKHDFGLVTSIIQVQRVSSIHSMTNALRENRTSALTKSALMIRLLRRRAIQLPIWGYDEMRAEK
ncbi:hypothetical protein Ahy_A06g028377 isoform A [Arachis hypogaea]|uniref:Uncharacterized protein n=1 Tax=Arachis hypogaea TaxID=3818 RepID=A0A445CQW4_ARAHY|nr:hypothetical protein Ahy_A06g028377 isoform A [Arachis hypogaea]